MPTITASASPIMRQVCRNAREQHGAIENGESIHQANQSQPAKKDHQYHQQNRQHCRQHKWRLLPLPLRQGSIEYGDKKPFNRFGVARHHHCRAASRLGTRLIWVT